jgi:predicted dehydrogenase
MAKKIGVGFVGTGGIADSHASGYRTSPLAEVTAVCDVRGAVADEKRRAYGARNSYTDYEKLVADPSVDAVDICVPNSLHSRVAVAAAEAGKHVLVEKPMAITVKQCDDMIGAARRHNVKLMVSHNQVFYPPHIEARRLIESEIGRPILLTTRIGIGFGGPPADSPPDPTNWRADPKVAGGGFLMEAGVHRIYLSRYLMGEVRKVYCVAAKTSPKLLSEDIALVLMEFANNSHGSLLGNTGGPFPLWDDRTEIVGSTGMIIVNGIEEQILPGSPLLLYKNGSWTLYCRKGHPATVGDIDLGTNEIEADFPKTYEHAVHHFIECVANDTDPLVSGEDGRRAIEIVLACYESSANEKPVLV